MTNATRNSRSLWFRAWLAYRRWRRGITLDNYLAELRRYKEFETWREYELRKLRDDKPTRET